MGIGDAFRILSAIFENIFTCRKDTQWELATFRYLFQRYDFFLVDEIPNGNWRLHRRLQHLTPEVGEIPNGNGNFWFFMTYLLFLSISRRNTAMGVGRDVYDFPGVVLRIGSFALNFGCG